MTIHMELFATSVSGPLRFALLLISRDPEQIGLYFFHDKEQTPGPLNDAPIWIDSALARSTLNGNPKPVTPDEHVEVMIRVLHEPRVRQELEIDVNGSSTHPMIKDYYRSVDALAEAESLHELSLRVRSGEDDSDSSSGGRRKRSGGL